MTDMICGVVMASVGLAILVLGFDMGKDSAVSDCKSFGAFKEAGVVYDCKPRSP